MNKEFIDTEGKQKLARSIIANNAQLTQARQGDMLENSKKDLESSGKNE